MRREREVVDIGENERIYSGREGREKGSKGVERECV
jgi:hypothetical protein